MTGEIPEPNPYEMQSAPDMERWRTLSIDRRDGAALAEWSSFLHHETELVSQELDDYHKRVEHAAGLYDKIRTSHQSGEHRWLEGGEVAREGVDKRYGTQSELYATQNRLKSLLLQRREQLRAADYDGTFLQPADEVDESVYLDYIGAPGQLPATFRLPQTDAPTRDIEEAAKLLNALPFLRFERLPREPFLTEPKTKIMGQIAFPVERIIGTASFDSWAGRVYSNGAGGKLRTQTTAEWFEPSSRGAIVEYAQLNPEGLAGMKDNPDIELIQDASGAFWGYAFGDGSHRIGAAKLRGEPTIPVRSVTIHAWQDMRRLPFSILPHHEE